MKRVSLLVLLCAALLAPAAGARPATVSTALLDVAGVPAQRLIERLEQGHRDVDAALTTRTQRLSTYQAAAAARDKKAGQIAALKAGGVDATTVRRAMSDALVLDERAIVARSQLLAAEAEVAKKGAELLQIYEAILVEKRREAMRADKQSKARARAVKAFRALSERRDAIRKALLPVLSQRGGADPEAMDEVAPQRGDDIETLLEKADLARDLEERFLRRAESVRKRIIELEAERAVARDVVGMVRSNNLFDETDRRLFVTGPAAGDARTATPGLFGIGAPGLASADSETLQDPAPPPADNGAVDIGDGRETPTESDDNQFSGREPSVGVTPDVSKDGITDADNNADVGRTADPGQAISSGVATEQSFEGLAGGGQARLNALLARDDLSLSELKELEARLRKQAADMKKQNRAIRTRIGEQMKR